MIDNIENGDCNIAEFENLDNHFIDYIALSCQNYIPMSQKVHLPMVFRGFIDRDIFFGKLFGENKKERYLWIQLTVNHIDKRKSYFLVRGNLKEWYFQKKKRRNLTTQEFKDAMKLLLIEIGLEENQLLKYKILVEKNPIKHRYKLIKVSE